VDSLLNEAKSFADVAKMEAKPKPAPNKIQNVNSSAELMPPLPRDEFAKGTYKPPMPGKTTFLLLHLSLLRDYIDEEFQDLKLKEILKDHPTVE
jgi:hypothetical protein